MREYNNFKKWMIKWKFWNVSIVGQIQNHENNMDC